MSADSDWTPETKGRACKSFVDDLLIKNEHKVCDILVRTCFCEFYKMCKFEKR